MRNAKNNNKKVTEVMQPVVTLCLFMFQKSEFQSNQIWID